MRTLRRISLASLVVVLAALDGVSVLGHGGVPLLSHHRPLPVRPAIVDYHLVRVVRVAREVNDFVYRATLRNGGTALRGATAQATSVEHGPAVVDGSLTFGPVRAHGFVVSSDTFSIRHHKGKPFHPQWPHVRWTITPTGTGGGSNRPPVANAGPDQTVGGAGSSARVLGATLVQLDGSQSNDPDGDLLRYQWTLVKPAGSTAVLSGPDTVSPTFTPDRGGVYEARLVVSDGALASAPDAAVVTVAGNTPPVANAGVDVTTFVSQTAALNGSASSDADGDSLTFTWSFVSRPAGSGAALSDPTVSSPTFMVDRPGSYVVRLVVNDGTADSAADTVTVTTQNRVPVANAGPDQTEAVGTTITLNGSGSNDPDGNALSYSWAWQSRPSGSSASLVNPTSVNPTFTIDRAGTYQVRLIVNDGTIASASDTVAISTSNSPPVANAGPDQTISVSQTVVTLDGSASSDVDGNSLTFAWTFSARPAGSAATLSNSTVVGPTFTADRPGTYRLQLVVRDGTVNSAPDFVDITTLNSAPVANAGPDQSVLVPTAVTLDGSGSTDVDGDTLTYVWALTSKPAGSSAALSNASAIMPTFTVDRAGTYVAQLTVNDGIGPSLADTVTVTTRNSAPVADAGPDQSVVARQTVSLDGIGSSDVDGNVLTFGWSFTSRPVGSTAVLANPLSSAPSFVADKPGMYVVQLIVNDGTVDSAPDTVTISTSNTTPVANAGPDQLGLDLGTIALDGSSSNDADGHTLTFQWSLLSSPAGSSAVLSDAAAVGPTFTADRPGDYVSQLIVTDGFVNSAPDTVLVTVVAPPTVTVSATDGSASETGPDAGTITVTRTGDLSAPLIVNYTVGGTATSVSDFAALSGSVTIPALQASAVVTITPVNDSASEVTETVVVTLTANAAYVVGAPDQATVTIADNDPIVVTIVATDPNASEVGPDTGTFTIFRTGSTSAPLTVMLGGPFGSAAFGSDYTLSSSGSVTIPAGQSSATVTVTPNADGITEGVESVQISIDPGAGYSVGSPLFDDVFIAAN